MNRVEVYFSLGSNLGDRESNLRKGLSLMEDEFGFPCTKVSSFIETLPWGFSSDDRFLNAAARFDFPLAGQDPVFHALSILKACKKIEGEVGRPHDRVLDENGNPVYSSRELDIDILLYGRNSIHVPSLDIPHPLMFERDFVMEPLSEVISSDIASFYGISLSQN